MKTLQKIFCLVPIQVVVFTLLFIKVARRHATCRLPPQADISCHFLRTPIHLPPFTGPEESQQAWTNGTLSKRLLPDGGGAKQRRFTKNLYFHETSCRGALTRYQACSVESASRIHPEWTIYVLFSAPIREHNMVDIRTSCPNVKFRRLYIEDHVKGTPIEKLLKSGRLNRTFCTYSQAADVLRYATLFKYPGVYLDLDIIMTRPLYKLGDNYVVREDEKTISAGLLDFSDDEVGRSMASEVAEEIASTFTHGKKRDGADAITQVLKRRCNTSRPQYMNKDKCKGFTVYYPKIIPLLTGQDSNEFFGVSHFYQQHEMCSNTLNAMAKYHCPTYI